MEFKVTFEDGSSAYLEHHGVMGMHWGVRNAETQAKYASGNGGQLRGKGSRPYSSKKSSSNDAMMNLARKGGFGLAGIAYAKHKDKQASGGAREKKRASSGVDKAKTKKSSSDSMMNLARKGGFGLAGIAYAKHKDKQASGTTKTTSSKKKSNTKTTKATSSKKTSNTKTASAKRPGSNLSAKDKGKLVVKGMAWQAVHPIKNAKNGVALAKAGTRAVIRSSKKKRK